MTKVEQQKLERTGEMYYNNNGEKMIIVEYKNWNDVLIEFENGYKTTTTYQHFKTGSVKNLFSPSVCNIGYYGMGKYQHSIDSNPSKAYISWKHMITRCYDYKKLLENPTYKDCTVCDEWHNFQNFAEWYDDNYYEISGETMCLDKDILHKGNKIYSPETCIFVPNNINILFTKRQNNRGDYPIGVTYHKNVYEARCSYIDENNNNKRKSIGSSKTPEGAFRKYKIFKENYIKEVANKYKDKIPQKLYEAMHNWIVEIND
jgi:hypothetical protein